MTSLSGNPEIVITGELASASPGTP